MDSRSFFQRTKVRYYNIFRSYGTACKAVGLAYFVRMDFSPFLKAQILSRKSRKLGLYQIIIKIADDKKHNLWDDNKIIAPHNKN